MTSRSRQPTDPAGLRGHALDYGRGGWSILPVKPQGKAPLTRHGVKDATSDLTTITEWWRRWPQANIGLAIPGGLVVLDLDSGQALGRLHAEGRGLPATARAETGKGQHLWYAVGSLPVRNCVRALRDIDIRASGGYVIVPPSRHPSGARYRWQVPLRPESIAEAPGWLVDLLRAPQAHPTPAGTSGGAWPGFLRRSFPPGERNQALARACGHFFHWLPPQSAAVLAMIWAASQLRPPLPEREVLRTINSIARRERQKPPRPA